jgi:DHA2 family multidrug resistance protein
MVRRDEFDALGFGMMSLAIGALQLMLDRGQIKDWFHSTEIWIEAIIAGLSFYLFVVHTVTAKDRSFVSLDLLKSPNFIAGSLLMLAVGWILSGTLALMPSMMQDLMNYPVFTSGWMMAPRGFGTMLAMIFVGRTINKIDGRLFIFVGFVLTAASLWTMTGYSLDMGSWPIISASFVQGFTLGLTFVPLNILALSDLPRHLLTQGTALRSLMRMLGGSIGISILEATLTQNTQIVHSRLVEGLRPDNPLIQGLNPHFSLTAPSGVAALNAEITRQAAMVGYIDDFKMMMLVILCALPLVLLIRVAPRAPVQAAAPATSSAAAGED